MNGTQLSSMSFCYTINSINSICQWHARVSCTRHTSHVESVLFVFLVSRDWCVALPHDATGGCLQFVIVVFPDHIHYLQKENGHLYKT